LIQHHTIANLSNTPILWQWSSCCQIGSPQ